MNATQAIERTSREAGALNLGEYLRLLSEVAGLPLRKLARDPPSNIPNPDRHISYVEAKHPDWESGRGDLQSLRARKSLGQFRSGHAGTGSGH